MPATSTGPVYDYRGTGMPARKTDKVRDFIAAGQWVEAFSIAKTFRMLTPDDKRAIVRAHEAIHHPAFYVQIRKDPDALITAGREVLARLYG